MFLSSFFLLWFETSVHFWSCFYQSFRIIAQIRIWNLGSLPIEKLFSCQSLVNFGLTYITLEVTVIRNTSFACPRRGLYVVTHISLKILSGLQITRNFFEILPHWGCFWPLKIQLGALELQRHFLILIPALVTTYLWKIPANCTFCIILT